MTRKQFDAKTVLITGGAAGVGRAAAFLFAQAGARVAILDVQEKAGLATVEELAAAGGRARFVRCDVSVAEQVRPAVQEVQEAFQTIDILFNHAGTVIVKPFLELSEADWDRMMAVNVKSMFLVTQAVLPGMLAAGSGVIINTASISGLTASALESVYCVSKGAVLQFTRAIAVEYRDRGIRCNALCPGFIRTDHGMREIEALKALGEPNIETDIRARQGRICQPEEVAHAALFLASDEASFVNGAPLLVDNAWMAMT